MWLQLFFNQPNKSLKSYTIFIILVAAGFLIECVGVATGKIFGNYRYGITLGSKLMEVPPIIGFNWLMLIMASGQIANKLKINIWLKAGIGSIMLVLLDFLIEPIAIQYDFWSWQNNQIPFQNYSSWFIVAYLFLLFYLKNNSKADNKAAQWLYLFQIIFFLTLNIFL